MAKNYHLQELKIELTRECPLRCLHCSSNGAPYSPVKLDPNRVCEIIREFDNMGGKTLAISGGEPLLYKELRLVLDICRDVGLEPQFYTTGITSYKQHMSPISTVMLEALKQCGAKVVFSVHGAKAETHDTLTQVIGSFDITIESLRHALTTGICAEVHIVPMAINFEEIADIVHLVISLGVRKVSWLRFVPQGRGESYRSQLLLNRDQIRQLKVMKHDLQRCIQR